MKQENKEIKKLVEIVPQAEEFNDILKTDIINSTSLSEKIADLFSAIFPKDLKGTWVKANQTAPNGVEVILYFEDRSGEELHDGFHAVKNLKVNRSEAPRHGGLEAWSRISAIQKATSLQPTQELIDVVSRYLPFKSQTCHKEKRSIGNGETKEVFVSNNFRNLCSELSENVYQGSSLHHVYLRVTGLDIVLLLADIYGRKDDNGVYDYRITPLKPLNNLGQENFLWKIEKLNKNKLAKLEHEAGMVPTTGTIPMVRR